MQVPLIDTASNWWASLTIPADGRVCIESDTGVYRVGDNVRLYRHLPIVFVGPNIFTLGSGEDIHAASSKATPVDADELALIDSAASNVLAKLTWANLKATLKTYFDSLTTTLTNKTLTAPVISTIVNTGTLTLPTSTDTLVGRATTDTLTLKRITPRVFAEASNATPTPPSDTADVYALSALAVNATFAAPSGTPTTGQPLLVRIVDNGTARTLAWNAAYRFSSDLAAPTTTVISKTMYLRFVWNAGVSKWDCIQVLGNF